VRPLERSDAASARACGCARSARLPCWRTPGSPGGARGACTGPWCRT
jgi:hypothetical protein